MSLLLAFSLSLSAWAQHYAPETEFHDPVQRVFVVEAARVLAWLANRQHSQIAEVSYQITTRPNQDTIWELTWFDAGSNALKSAKVKYEQTLLKQGAEYYRYVILQLLAKDWPTLPKQNMTAAEAVKLFWAGASQAGPSREATLSRAFSLLNATETAQAPRGPELAGLLVHAALPGVAGHLTIDPLLVARAAAWLAFTEHTGPMELTQLWGPVLFLAGREQAARASWGKEGRSDPGNGMLDAWTLWMKQPTSLEVFLFAAGSTNWPITMAMLTHDVSVNDSGALLAEVAAELFGSPQVLAALHNYAPFLARRAGVAGGRIMNGLFPVYQRQAWLATLETYASTKDAKGDLDYAAELRAAAAEMRKNTKPDAMTDASVSGFNAFVPLLRLGHQHGDGKLTPTAVATARDLLNYGWQAAGLQMGTRFRFFHNLLGIVALSEPIISALTNEIRGLSPFFLPETRPNSHNYRRFQPRLEQVDNLPFLVGWSPAAATDAVASSQSAWLFAKRCWLRPSELRWQVRALWDEKQMDRVLELLEDLREEGGSLGAAAALEYLVSMRTQSDMPMPEELLGALAEMLPQPTRLYVNAVWVQQFLPKPKLERAQAMEKMYWRNPDCALEDWIFSLYGQAGAYAAARRFYAQARENFLDPVKTSDGVGGGAYIAGYFLQDAALRKMAMEDSNSGNFSHLTMQIWDAVIEDKPKALQERVDEMATRYQSSRVRTLGRHLAGFLPLLPALADGTHADHEKALRYFGTTATWTILRWIWIHKHKLSKNDAIQFLGGYESPDLFRQILIAYLDGDVAQLNELYGQFDKQTTATAEQTFIAAFLTRTLNKQPPVVNAPDLKPAEVSLTRAVVLARLRSKRR